MGWSRSRRFGQTNEAGQRVPVLDFYAQAAPSGNVLGAGIGTSLGTGKWLWGRSASMFPVASTSGKIQPVAVRAFYLAAASAAHRPGALPAALGA